MAERSFATEVGKLRALPQNYSLLDYLNVGPRLTYLGRIRNPNPAMPGAKLHYIPSHDPAESHPQKNDHPTTPLPAHQEKSEHP